MELINDSVKRVILVHVGGGSHSHFCLDRGHSALSRRLSHILALFFTHNFDTPVYCIMKIQMLSFLSLLLVGATSAYPFEFSLTLEGPHQLCDKRDFRMIMHGIEDAVDHKGTEYLRDQGYHGFLDELEVHFTGGVGRMTQEKKDGSGLTKLGPFYGEGRCESCPKDDQDSYYFRRRSFLGESMSKQRITAFINDDIQRDIAEIVSVRGSPECAGTAGQWKANFIWL